MCAPTSGHEPLDGRAVRDASAQPAVQRRALFQGHRWSGPTRSSSVGTSRGPTRRTSPAVASSRAPSGAASKPSRKRPVTRAGSPATSRRSVGNPLRPDERSRGELHGLRHSLGFGSGTKKSMSLFKVGSPLPRCATRRHGTRARCCGHPACPNRARTRIRQARTGSRRVAAARSGHRSFVEPARPFEWAQGSRRGPGDPATRSRRCTRRRQGRARGWVAQ